MSFLVHAMQINLHQLVPISIQDQIKQSEIWSTELSLSPSTYYQIYSTSGKGKTTFCHILYGLRNEYTGEFDFDGKPARYLSKEDWAILRREKISFLFQDLRLFQELTGFENIEIKMHLGSSFLVAQVIEMAKMLDVDKCLHKPIKILSFGERQRIALIRALIQPFEVLLLDEPFSHLDPENIKKACGLIDTVCKKNKATLILMSLMQDDVDIQLPFDQKLCL